jgi:hypothetical protein
MIEKTEAQIQEARAAARAEQAANVAAATDPLAAYWAGSIGASVALDYKHGAVRVVHAGRKAAARKLLRSL